MSKAYKKRKSCSLQQASDKRILNTIVRHGWARVYAVKWFKPQIEGKPKSIDYLCSELCLNPLILSYAFEEGGNQKLTKHVLELPQQDFRNFLRETEDYG